MAGFLSNLGQAINQQFAMGQTTPTSIDGLSGSGRTTDFGLLSKVGNAVDFTAQRNYIENGYISNIAPRIRTVLEQVPQLSIIIKKRMFSSLAENFSLETLDADEKLFIKASKKLFQNKCNLINAYERLSKIDNSYQESGQLNSYMFPMLMSGFDTLSQSGINFFDDATSSAFEELRKVMVFSEPTSFTTWDIDPSEPYASSTGEGIGTFEITTVASVNTKTGVNFASGHAGITIEDFYKLTIITNDDIENAIMDSQSFFDNAFGNFTQTQTQNLISTQTAQLNSQRVARGSSSINFILNPVSIVSKNVQAILNGGLVAINTSNASPEINFTYNAGLAGIGSDVDVDPTALTSFSPVNTNGLNSEDLTLFKQIIKNIYLQMALQNETRNHKVQYNQQTNYVRRKMQLHFSGKSIIQPMDIVNIFISSKTMRDEKIIQGFDQQSAGNSIGSKLNSLVMNINTLHDKFGNTLGPTDELEKAQIVGSDFPTWLWRLYRNDFTKQSAGVSVFVGLVSNTTSNYSDGKYVLSVDCEDNAGYFTKSQINLKPSTDVFNSNLYDPLTPFKTSFDGVSGDVSTSQQQGQFPQLLQENINLLQSSAVRFHNGRFRGSQVDPLLYQSKDGELYFDTFRQVLNDPLGFVYRWKEGIGTLTKLDGAFPTGSTRQESSPALTTNPFAGQDVMNVLSLFITGQPYNYNTFLAAAMANGNNLVKKNNQSNSDVATSYIQTLTDSLSKRNLVWGNFVPFKKLVISTAADAFILTGQANFTTQNSNLTDLINQRATLMDKVALQNKGYATNTSIVGNNALGNFTVGTIVNTNAANNLTDNISLQVQLSDINSQINAAKQAFTNTINNLYANKQYGSITIFGNDISTSSNYGNSTSITNEQASLDKQEMQLRLNAITLRRNWKVKANEDTNLFIVDDQYDKNFDIQAFDHSLGGRLELFKSEYTTIDQQIKQTAEILGLEIFADSQGHIQARPPHYNRMPSSVFYRMFKTKRQNGTQIFPQFLESLLTNQLQSYIDNIEIDEDQIRLRVLALGVVPTTSIDPDKDIAAFIEKKSSGVNGSSGFAFVSDFNTGMVGGFEQAFQKFISQSSPDINENFIDNTLRPISQTIGTNLVSNVVFDPITRDNDLNQVSFSTAFAADNATRISLIASRLQSKGITGPNGAAFTLRTIFSSDKANGFTTFGQISQLDAIKVMNDIASFISDRQKLLLTTSNTIKNLTQGIQLNDAGKGITSALYPNLNTQQPIPTILQHMIEDENNDDLGPGSGQRFIIQEAQIISLKITETPPPHTLVQVNGLFGQGLPKVPGSLGIDSSGGNAIATAYAVDYDMWRMYGFRTPWPVNAPFFSDADTQCAPYAVFLLNLARKDILQGTLDVVGNEYYQAGDVIYIQYRDLLFYVTEVNHNFSYRGQFTTSLQLRYGHNPGEYIPTMMDIVGNFLYQSKGNTGFYRSNRFEVASGGKPVGVVIFDNAKNSDNTLSTLQQLISGNRGAQNQKVMTQLLMSLSGILNAAPIGGQIPVLELRVYTNSTVPTVSGVDQGLVYAANTVADWLQNPTTVAANGDIIPINKQNEGINIAKNSINVRTIDTSLVADVTPSASAWNAVRTILSEGQVYPDAGLGQSQTGVVQRQLDLILFTNIIDAWVNYETIPTTVQTGGEPDTSEAGLEKAATLQGAATNFAKFGAPTQ